jgi:Ni,Fe-hydrogenase III large subunit
MPKATIPIGPQHPVLKEPLSFLVTVDGERVEESTLRIGYVHRGIERLAQERTFLQNIHLMERVCGICSHSHTTTYCQAVEALAAVEAPIRSRYVRTLFCELERMHSHLLWLGVLTENMGFRTIFMYAWDVREHVLDIMEMLSGGRISNAVNVIGGVRIDMSGEQAEMIQPRLDDLEKRVKLFLGLVERERTFRARTTGIGRLSSEDARRYCVSGPVARASGIDFDIRRDTPYGVYDRLEFEVITHTDGDVWAGTLVRVMEILESIKICRQILVELPDGPIAEKAPRKVPAGEVTSRTEAPRGELFYYIRSDGSDRPARLKIRTPTIPTLATVLLQLVGVETADIPVVLSGVDLCIACVDR